MSGNVISMQSVLHSALNGDANLSAKQLLPIEFDIDIVDFDSDFVVNILIVDRYVSATVLSVNVHCLVNVLS